MSTAAGSTRLDDAALVAWTNDGLRAGDLDRVVEGLTELHRRHPANAALGQRLAMALNNRGARSARNGAVRAAEDDMRRALELVPDHPEALYNRARFLSAARQWREALAVLERLAALRPDDPEVALDHAEAAAMADIDGASAQLEACIARCVADGSVDPLRLATAHATLGRSADALAALVRADGPDALRLAAETGDRLREGDDWRAAREAFAIAAGFGGRGTRSPSLRAVIGSRFALPMVYRDHANLDAARASYETGLTQHVTEFDDARLAGCEPVLEQLAWTQQMLAYQGRDDRLPADLWGDWLDLALHRFAPRFMQAPLPLPGRAPRIGVVSSRLYRTVLGNYFGTWIGGLAEGGFEPVVFLVDTPADEITARITARAAATVRLAGSIESMAEAIQSARLDALLFPDVGIDPRTSVLAAMRLAPRQFAAWGHPETTGLRSIDAFISCASMEGPGAHEHYRESLLLLPGTGTEFLDPGEPAACMRADFDLPDDARVYLVPHVPPKLHPDCDAVFAAIAARDPRAILVLFAFDRPVVRETVLQRMTAALARAGADPVRQLRVMPLLARARFLGLCSVADVMLDTLHWSGGANTIDALRCRLPVVACPGPLMRGRQTLGMLQAIGLADELAASSPAAMAELASAIAGDRDRRAALAARIDERLPVLFDGRAALAALAAALHGAIGA
jgi:predicted O-linked N-acetylglucosamine transferase (SPINDLY family)